MTRIVLYVPSSDAPLREEISPGEALLLGRSPDPSMLASAGVAVPVPTVRALPVAAPSVSALHALVWHDGERVYVRDLASRNGTWLRLPSRETLSFEAPAELSLRLALTAETAGPRARPDDAQWTSLAEFPAAVATALDRWLESMGAGLRAQAVRGARGHWLPAIPLLDDWQVQLVAARPDATVDPLWGTLVQVAVEYVHDQRALARAEVDAGHDDGFVLASPVFREAHRKVVDAASRGLQLILLGPTGAGKGTLARCYHLHSARRAAPFESVNCAEIDKHFARTKIFGAKKGAYTGCTADVAGAVECARGGTLFLDELADLSLEVQGELLTFLDDQRYKRLGDDQWRQADVRVVCGTNGDLRDAVRAGRFRADLWYRLAGRVVEVPPLRERPEDVAAFLRARQLGESREAVSAWDALSAEAQALVRAHPWRGNFRELAAFARRLPEATAPGVISARVCLDALREGALDPSAAPSVAPGADGWTDLLSRATSVYQQKNNAAAPTRSAELKDYMEEILKPLFFARALELESLEELPERPVPSFEELGRRLGCDGATVKNQLVRYVAMKKHWLKAP